jgi:hypothetical protein
VSAGEPHAGGSLRVQSAVIVRATRGVKTSATTRRHTVLVEPALGIWVPKTWPLRRAWGCPRTRATPRRSATTSGRRQTMTDPITVTIAPEADRVRILATTPTHDLLKAVLGPAREAHPRAAATLLEGLALWHQRPLCIVLSADASVDGHALGICDALGFGRTLHYEVSVAFGPERHGRRRRDLRGLGDFRDLRQLSLLERTR